MFDDITSSVVLVHKQRPKWQQGFWNGVGGNIEPGETPLQAMVREYGEEAGMIHRDWTHFGTLCVNPRQTREGPVHDTVWLYRACCQACFVQSRTPRGADERIAVFEIRDLPRVVPNLRWMVPMAASLSYTTFREPYRIYE